MQLFLSRPTALHAGIAETRDRTHTATNSTTLTCICCLAPVFWCLIFCAAVRDSVEKRTLAFSRDSEHEELADPAMLVSVVSLYVRVLRRISFVLPADHAARIAAFGLRLPTELLFLSFALVPMPARARFRWCFQCSNVCTFYDPPPSFLVFVIATGAMLTSQLPHRRQRSLPPIPRRLVRVRTRCCASCSTRATRTTWAWSCIAMACPSSSAGAHLSRTPRAPPFPAASTTRLHTATRLRTRSPQAFLP